MSEPPETRAPGTDASAPGLEPETETTDATGTDPASAAAPPSRRAALMRSGLIIGVLVVLLIAYWVIRH